MIEETAFAGGSAWFADEVDGIDFDQERSRATRVGGFWVEDVSFAERKGDGVEFAGAFVKEVAEVGGGSLRGGDGEVHVR